jgi:TPR repeat protein
MAMSKLFTALMLIVSMGVTGSLCAQDYEKGLKAYNAQDYATALKEWRFLAERGNARAQYVLGHMYINGEGVIQNDKEAATWFRKAAEQGDVNGQLLLGRMYRWGEGVIQNDKEAATWFRKAAEQGHEGAQFSLGSMYAHGRGVVQNNIYAHIWYNIAASNGDKHSSKLRDEIAAKMTAADISRAQELARECEKKQYKGC